MHCFLTSLPLYLTIHPLYLCHQDQCINYTKPTLCMTSHTLYVWHHSQYVWHHMNTLWHHTRIGVTSHTVYLWHHNNIYDINATAFMKTQLYLTSHTLYVTSQPLYLSCNTRCIDWLQQFRKLSDLAHIWYHTHSTWHHSHTLWHHSSVFMTSQPTAFMTSYTLHRTSPPGFMTSRPLSLWHHRHYLCEYISTIFNIKQTVQRQYNPYIWNHNLHMCICVITHTVLMI